MIDRIQSQFGDKIKDAKAEGVIDPFVEVGADDLVEVILAWGACSPACPEDVNADGQVDVQDLVAVITAWGAC